MNTDTIRIDKLFSGGYSVYVRKNKHTSWEYVAETPHWKMCFPIARAGKEMMFEKTMEVA